MSFKLRSSLALALMISAGVAQAGPFLSFEGVGYGAQVLDFYNGGTDSQGNRGPNYGIRFSEGTVEYNKAGAYISGRAVMHFAPDIVPVVSADSPYFGIAFLATDYSDDGNYVDIYGPQYRDNQFIQGMRNPFCSSWTQCVKEGWSYIPPSTLFGYMVYSDGTANRISFNTYGLDNIHFGILSRPARRVIEVPEPATVGLMLAAGAGLLVSRRRRSRLNAPASSRD